MKKVPEHQAVYERIRDMILLGRLIPGQPLTIMGLSEQLGVGMTPVREAIRRLTAENAINAQGNRRVVVPQLPKSTLEEIYFLRLKVEPELTRRATPNIKDNKLEELTAINAEIDHAIKTGDVEDYLESNNRFHFKIYEQANAPVLFRIAQTLWVQAGPSLRVICGRYGTANLPDKHVELLSALKECDAQKAALAMVEDLEQGLNLVTASIQ